MSKDDDSDSQIGVGAGDNFFEEESLSSNSSSDSGDDLVTPPSGGARGYDMYERYFGGKAWKGTVEKTDMVGGSSPRVAGSPSNPKSRSAAYGPSSDMLTPIVTVSHELNDKVLNHQSVALAMGFELGGWDSTKTFEQSDIPSFDEEQESKVDPAYDDDPEFPVVVRKGKVLFWRHLFLRTFASYTIPLLFFFIRRAAALSVSELSRKKNTNPKTKVQSGFVPSSKPRCWWWQTGPFPTG